MTQKDFLQEVRQAYLKARKFIYTPKENIEVLRRGTSHSISSICEDLFGCYCANRVLHHRGTQIFIDPPISVFDIKTDLGYKRKIFF